MVNTIECVADAIQHYEGWYPTSRSYRNRNPGNLRASSLSHVYDENGYCVFPNYATGYQALLDELDAKFSGHNAHGIGPSSTLQDLFNVYAPRADGNNPDNYALFVAAWIARATDETVTVSSTLAQIQHLSEVKT